MSQRLQKLVENTRLTPAKPAAAAIFKRPRRQILSELTSTHQNSDQKMKDELCEDQPQSLIKQRKPMPLLNSAAQRAASSMCFTKVLTYLA